MQVNKPGQIVVDKQLLIQAINYMNISPTGNFNKVDVDSIIMGLQQMPELTVETAKTYLEEQEGQKKASKGSNK